MGSQPESMNASDLTELWCFGEGSIWWRMQYINEFTPLVEGIDLEVVKDHSINAQALAGRLRPKLVFNDGLVLRLVDLYRTMLSRWPKRDCFGLPARQPEDRDAIAFRLARITIDFLVLHEICHVGRGHLDHYFPARANFGFVEFAARSAGSPRTSADVELDPLTRRLLEVDADVSAIFLLGILVKPMSQQVKRYQFPTSASREQVLRLVLHVLFLLFSSGTGALNPERHETLVPTHPHPLIRARILNAYVNKAIDRPGRFLAWYRERTTRYVLQFAAERLREANVQSPEIGHAWWHHQFVVDRGNLIVDRRTEAWPVFVANSRWAETARRMDIAAQG